MFTKNYTVRFYTFDELDEMTKERLINQVINDLLLDPCCDSFDFVHKAIEEAEKLQTPWFANEYVWEYGKEEILQVLSEQYYTKYGTTVEEFENEF